jgi:antitoxin HicB
MQTRFPVVLDPEPDGSAINVSFPDVRGALTWGDDGAEALSLAEDCLIAALGGYMKLNKSIPRPSPSRGRPTVTLPPLVAAKLALYEAMRTRGVSGEDLAARLGIAEPAVRRLLDLDHRSHIDQVEAALRCLGKRLEVTVRDAA